MYDLLDSRDGHELNSPVCADAVPKSSLPSVVAMSPREKKRAKAAKVLCSRVATICFATVLLSVVTAAVAIAMYDNSKSKNGGDEIAPPYYYSAAAIQFERAQSSDVPPGTSEWEYNVGAYESYIAAAKQAVSSSSSPHNLDLVVFPEGANGWFPNDAVTADNVVEFADVIPKVSNGSPAYNPCEQRTGGQLHYLSCLALSSSVGLVANIVEVRNCSSYPDLTPQLYEVGDPPCPTRGHYFFNAAVAFDKRGNLLAKYYKRHISGEIAFISQPLPTRLPVYFDLEIQSTGGVNRFGLMICNDISFTDQLDELLALGIKDIIFSTHFANAVPMFRMGLSFQGWSLANGVNFIVANGASGPETTMGGGIYAAGAVLDYFYDTSPAAPTRSVTVSSLIPLNNNSSFPGTSSRAITSRLGEDESLFPRGSPPGVVVLPPSTLSDCSTAGNLAKYGITGKCKLLSDAYVSGDTPLAIDQVSVGGGTFRCEVAYTFATTAEQQGKSTSRSSVEPPLVLLAEKYALVNFVFAQTPVNECEGLDFRVCLLVYCPNFPDCAARDDLPPPSTPLVSFDLAGRGFNEWKTSSLPSVAGVGGLPIKYVAGENVGGSDGVGWEMKKSAMLDAMAISSVAGKGARGWGEGTPVDAVTLTGIAPYQNICWK